MFSSMRGNHSSTLGLTMQSSPNKTYSVTPNKSPSGNSEEFLIPQSAIWRVTEARELTRLITSFAGNRTRFPCSEVGRETTCATEPRLLVGLNVLVLKCKKKKKKKKNSKKPNHCTTTKKATKNNK
jgi:hypothetical protein